MIWLKRCQILLDNEELNTEQMKFILGKRHETVRELRIEMLADFKSKGIELYDNRFIPTDLFLEYIEKDYSYFENKAKREARLKELERRTHESK